MIQALESKIVKPIGFDEGVQRIVGTILDKKDTNAPVLVFINGYPNSGKSYLKKTVRDTLCKNKIFGWCGMRGDPLDVFPERGLFWDETIKDFVLSNKLDYFLIEDIGNVYSAELYTKEMFNKPFDLKVLVGDNSGFIDILGIERGDYDLIIRNEFASNHRKLCKD